MTARYFSGDLPDLWHSVHHDVDSAGLTDSEIRTTWDQLEALIRDAVPAAELAHDVRRRVFKLSSSKVRIEVEIRATTKGT